MEPPAERALNAVEQFILSMLPSCRQIAHESNLKTTDLQVLHLIHLRRELTTASRLCSLSGLPSSTMTRVLDRLEEGGFIIRILDPQDRRLRLISTVPDRVESIIAHFAPAKKTLEGELSACPETELNRIFEFLSGVASIQSLLTRSEFAFPEMEESIR